MNQLLIHDKCAAFEARIKILEDQNKKMREALEKIANDRSPPWDKMDYKDIATEALGQVKNV